MSIQIRDGYFCTFCLFFQEKYFETHERIPTQPLSATVLVKNENTCIEWQSKKRGQRHDAHYTDIYRGHE